MFQQTSILWLSTHDIFKKINMFYTLNRKWAKSLRLFLYLFIVIRLQRCHISLGNWIIWNKKLNCGIINWLLKIQTFNTTLMKMVLIYMKRKSFIFLQSLEDLNGAIKEVKKLSRTTMCMSEEGLETWFTVFVLTL